MDEIYCIESYKHFQVCCFNSTPYRISKKIVYSISLHLSQKKTSMYEAIINTNPPYLILRFSCRSISIRVNEINILYTHLYFNIYLCLYINLCSLCKF